MPTTDYTLKLLGTGGEKFQCILTAPLARKVFDILPSRNISTVQEYLRGFPQPSRCESRRDGMNKGFCNVAKAFLPNAKIVIDRFHVVRYCTEATDVCAEDCRSP